MFLFWFDIGVAGPAWATIFAQFVSVAICYDRLRRVREFRLNRCDFVFDKKMGMELLRNGVPMALMNSITSLGCIFVQGCINDYGVVYTSAYAVCNKYLNVFMLPGITLGFAVSAFAGQNFGAKKYERIRSGIRTACIMALCWSVFLGVILFSCSKPLAGLLLAGQAAVACTVIYLKYLALFLVLLNLLFVFRSCVQGMGKPAVPLCSGIVEMAVRICAIFLGLPAFGFAAAVFAEGLAWLEALLLNLVSYLFYIRQHTDT